MTGQVISRCIMMMDVNVVQLPKISAAQDGRFVSIIGCKEDKSWILGRLAEISDLLSERLWGKTPLIIVRLASPLAKI